MSALDKAFIRVYGSTLTHDRDPLTHEDGRVEPVGDGAHRGLAAEFDVDDLIQFIETTSQVDVIDEIDPLVMPATSRVDPRADDTRNTSRVEEAVTVTTLTTPQFSFSVEQTAASPVELTVVKPGPVSTEPTALAAGVENGPVASDPTEADVAYSDEASSPDAITSSVGAAEAPSTDAGEDPLDETPSDVVESDVPDMAQADEAAEASNDHSEKVTSAADSAAEDPAAETEAAQQADPPEFPLRTVERFQWPETCVQLRHDAAAEFAALRPKLLELVRDGHNVVAVSGVERGVGRTTVALALAHWANEEGGRVALIELTGTRLSTVLCSGQAEPAAADTSVPRAIASDEGVTVFSLAADHTRPRAEITREIAHIAGEYDLAIVDIGLAGELVKTKEMAAPFDAAILVCDVNTNSTNQIVQAQRCLYAAGISTVGVAENFRDEPELSLQSKAA